MTAAVIDEHVAHGAGGDDHNAITIEAYTGVTPEQAGISNSLTAAELTDLSGTATTSHRSPRVIGPIARICSDGLPVASMT